MAEDWILLHTTAVRVGDIRRIELDARFGVTYLVTLTHGPTIRVDEKQEGAKWLFLQLRKGRDATRAAAAEYDELFPAPPANDEE
jgi:hypothetical protein